MIGNLLVHGKGGNLGPKGDGCRGAFWWGVQDGKETVVSREAMISPQKKGREENAIEPQEWEYATPSIRGKR